MNHKELDVWKNSIEFSVLIYRLTESFPKVEQYGIASQMRRAAVSISSNIAEGSGRNTTNDFIRFLYISLGSVTEIETQLIIAHKLGYFEKLDEYLNKLSKISQPLMGLIRQQKKRASS